ncbi:helix-turn-helix domain-containing protein [Embleya hyalina]|uniref:Putative AraC-family regulatory protein n=1 Tax=Embleya hyalina TaxID=516124 RepID=A0A401YVV4_9ACTN|nr:helix-turn-helix domain-containing protein [Embleya hyalina]GCD98701.1 putative AraC-family regulatory protein [Embleya hyalina]
MVPTDTLHVTRHTSALGSMETVSAPAHPALAPLLHSCLGYDERLHAPLRRREVATGSITVIIGFVPIRVHSPHAGLDTPGTTHSFVAGLHGGPAIVEHDGRQAGIQLDLTPLGAYTLLGLPLAEIADRVVHLDDLPGWDGDALVDRLVSAPDWATRFAHLDEILLRRLDIGPEPLPEVIRSWDLLTASAGRIDVTSLARETGWSRRHLGARFRETVGLPPKTMARVLRFRHAIALLDGAPRSWAEVAAEAGYYDQAHFNRDFKVLAGCTPGAYLGSRLPAGGFAG